MTPTKQKYKYYITELSKESVIKPTTIDLESKEKYVTLKWKKVKKGQLIEFPFISGEKI